MRAPIFLAAALTFAHCGGSGSALEDARMAADVARVAYDHAASVFLAQCTARYQVANTDEQIHALDAKCLPARDALDAYRMAWLELADAVEMKRDPASLADLAARLPALAAASTKALEDLR